MLQVAILGVGWAGTRHVEAIRELGRKLAVNCLVDHDTAFLTEKAESLGVTKTYTDYSDALKDPEVDAVSICLPHAMHAQVAVEAASAGKHVLCEKPMAMTVAEATQMIEAAEAHDVTLYVAENASYAASAVRLREIVASGEFIGELTYATLRKGFQAQDYGFTGRRRWLSTPEVGGTGTWMLHGIHSMAQLRFVLGEVETVYVRQHRASSFERGDVEGTMSGLLTLKRGVHVAVVQTPETRIPYPLRGYTLYGDRGVIQAGRESMQIFSEAIGAKDQAVVEPYPEAPMSTYAQEMEAFADTVAGIAVGPTTGRSERRSLAIVQAGYESAESGQPVNLEARFGAL